MRIAKSNLKSLCNRYNLSPGEFIPQGANSSREFSLSEACTEQGRSVEWAPERFLAPGIVRGLHKIAEQNIVGDFCRVGQY